MFNIRASVGNIVDSLVRKTMIVSTDLTFYMIRIVIDRLVTIIIVYLLVRYTSDYLPWWLRLKEP